MGSESEEQDGLSTNPMIEPAHKEICIQFTLGGQAFEAVGFLDAEEESVSLDEVFRRTNNGGIVGWDEFPLEFPARHPTQFEFLMEHLLEIPKELEDYVLVTACVYPWYGGRVSVLRRRCRPGVFNYVLGLGEPHWSHYGGLRTGHLGRLNLILRRKVS